MEPGAPHQDLVSSRWPQSKKSGLDNGEKTITQLNLGTGQVPTLTHPTPKGQKGLAHSKGTAIKRPGGDSAASGSGDKHLP